MASIRTSCLLPARAQIGGGRAQAVWGHIVGIAKFPSTEEPESCGEVPNTVRTIALCDKHPRGCDRPAERSGRALAMLMGTP